MKLKAILTSIIIGLDIIIGLPLLFIGSIAGYNLYLNLNPDFVNLEKDRFIKVFSFVTTQKEILVEIYGRPGKQPNSGEFVVVKTGLLPFKLKTISKKALGKEIWRKNPSDPNLTFFAIWINFKYTAIPRFETASFIHSFLAYDNQKKAMIASKGATIYACCDFIPYFPFIEYYRCFRNSTFPESYSDPHSYVKNYTIYEDNILQTFSINSKGVL